MDLTQIIHEKALKFLDSVERAMNDNVNFKLRNEEMNVFSMQKDYETEVKKAMRDGQVAKAKEIYKTVLEKYNSELSEDNRSRIMKVLERITRIIRDNIKEYNQEIFLKPEMDEYDMIVDQRRAIPQEITGKATNVSFFNETESKRLKKVQAQNEKKSNFVNLDVSRIIGGNPFVNSSNSPQSYSESRTITQINNHTEPELNQELLEEMQKNGIDFKQARIEYSEENPTHKINLYSKYENGYLIFVESTKTKEPEIFKINVEPKHERVILTEV